MITSFIEMLELPNFTQFESSDKILLVTSWTEILTSKPLFQNTFTLRRSGVINFVDIIKIAIMTIDCLRQFVASENPLKMMKNAFYYTSIASRDI